MTIKEQIQRIKNTYEKDFNALILESIRENKLRVMGSLTGLSVHSVSLHEVTDDHTESNHICNIWTENIDEELSELKEYGYQPPVEKEMRHELLEYIKKNLNK